MPRGFCKINKVLSWISWFHSWPLESLNPRILFFSSSDTLLSLKPFIVLSSVHWSLLVPHTLAISSPPSLIHSPMSSSRPTNCLLSLHWQTGSARLLIQPSTLRIWVAWHMYFKPNLPDSRANCQLHKRYLTALVASMWNRFLDDIFKTNSIAFKRKLEAICAPNWRVNEV